MSTGREEDYSRTSPASFLARGIGKPFPDANDGGNGGGLILGTEVDHADPEYAGFLQETERGAKSHVRYDELVSKVAAERDVDIDIHSGFGDLEQDDIEDEEELKQDR